MGHSCYLMFSDQKEQWYLGLHLALIPSGNATVYKKIYIKKTVTSTYGEGVLETPRLLHSINDKRLCLLLAINVIQGHLYCIWEKYRFRVHVNSFVSAWIKRIIDCSHPSRRVYEQTGAIVNTPHSYLKNQAETIQVLCLNLNLSITR